MEKKFGKCIIDCNSEEVTLASVPSLPRPMFSGHGRMITKYQPLVCSTHDSIEQMPISQGPPETAEVKASKDLSFFHKARYFIYDDKQGI